MKDTAGQKCKGSVLQRGDEGQGRVKKAREVSFMKLMKDKPGYKSKGSVLQRGNEGQGRVEK